MTEPRSALEQRVLVLAPTGKDAALARSVLRASGVASLTCADVATMMQEAAAGVGALILAEEAIVHIGPHRLAALLDDQPPWSDLPVLVLTQPGADSAAISLSMEVLGNVTMLERPVRVAALVSAVRAALRARQRQYQIRQHLLARERAEEALLDSNRRKDEFLATLSHELRNPLAPICNALHILRLTGADHPAFERVGNVMERQVQHLVRLVDDLLEVSRITRGKIDLRRESIDLAVVLQNAMETSRPLIDAAHHRLIIAIPSEPLRVHGDAVRLAQVFANLLNNAAKYTEPGGRLWLRAAREDDAVVVSVRDSGVGIAPEMLPRVFDMFMQADRSGRRAPGGLGIGLTLVKSLVEMHDGSVTAHSDGPGAGSEFVVRLPAEGVVTAQAAGSRRRAPAGIMSGRRILVVDDNRDAADSLGTLLRLLGADVHVVHSGLDALDELDGHQPSVVLLDIGMPGMDGYEVARRIRQRADGEQFTLIALTGWGQEQDRRQSRAAGFDHHLIKPAQLGALESLFASLPA